MEQKLGEITEIQMGLYSRDELASSGAAGAYIAQMSSITENNRLDLSRLGRSAIPVFKSIYALKRGDLVFRSRGHRRMAAIVDTEVNDNTFFAAPLMRIRANQQRVLPEYLKWAINSPTAQAYLDKYAEGTSIKMINREVLEGLPIILPPMETQKKIAELSAIAEQEQRLLHELADKKAAYIQGILTRLAAEGSQLNGGLGK